MTPYDVFKRLLDETMPLTKETSEQRAALIARFLDAQRWERARP